MIESWRLEWESTLIPRSILRKAIAGQTFINWLQRSFGGMNFRLTQVLSDHGCFRKFLYRIRKVDSTLCLYCREGIDTSEHTIFACSSWQNERRETFDSIECYTMEDIIKTICIDKDKWKSFNLFVNNIMIQKENLEREIERERQEAANRNRSNIRNSRGRSIARQRQRREEEENIVGNEDEDRDRDNNSSSIIDTNGNSPIS